MLVAKGVFGFHNVSHWVVLATEADADPTFVWNNVVGSLISARIDRDDSGCTRIDMLASAPQRPNGDRNVDVALVAIAIAMLVMGALYGGALMSAIISGHQLPHRLDGPINALGHPTDPSLAWRSPVGSPWIYWSAETSSLVLVALVLYWGWRVLSPRAPRSEVASLDPTQLEGMAERTHIAALAGPKVLLSQAGVLRPSIADAQPRDVGFYLGTSRGVDCWMGVRDSLVILGPPGSGKGLNLIIPSILDAPGAVITTSTRPDNLAVTLTRRGSDGRPVGVFDPHGLAIGAPSTLRWSPVRGCERAQTAMVRAKALCA
ncbi:MAG: type IV secretory system conjugative DNA transfer family protein, partial [Ferrimicrobium sp.]